MVVVMMKKTGIKAFDIKVFFGGIIITCCLVAYSAFTSVEMLKRDARHVADVIQRTFRDAFKQSVS